MVLNDLWPKSRQINFFLITCQMTLPECRHCILFMHHLVRLAWSIFGFLIFIVAVLPTCLLTDLICNFHYQTLMIINRFNYSHGCGCPNQNSYPSTFLFPPLDLQGSGRALVLFISFFFIFLSLIYLCLSLRHEDLCFPISQPQQGACHCHYLFLSSHFWSLSVPPHPLAIFVPCC